MAEGTDDSQKTEEPTQRKLQRARGEGQVAQSREVSTWFMLMAGAGVVLVMGPSLARNIGGALAGFVQPTQYLAGDGILWGAVIDALERVAMALALPALVLVTAAIAGTVMQTGLLFAVEKLGLHPESLSPMTGLKRMFSTRSAVELVKSIAKVGVVAAVATIILRPELNRLPLLDQLPAEAILNEIYRVVLRLLSGVIMVVTALAGADYFYQRLSLRRTLRMSKQEMKDEAKQAEGDPLIKARLRQIRHERSRRRMMAAVPKASVVITNPTHFAVALQYEMGTAGAPKLVAKGADLVAKRIREIAVENGVPIIENPPLARALFASVEIDREIPPEHYKAVAEIIGYVFRLKGKLQR